MARGKKVAMNLEEVQQLRAQGTTAAAIARRLGIPVTTLKSHLQRAQALDVPNVHNCPPAPRSTDVYIGIPPTDVADFQAMLAWWRRRQHLLAASQEAPADTERWTLHVEKPFIQRVKAEADAEHVTVTELINRIIRHYYQRV